MKLNVTALVIGTAISMVGIFLGSNTSFASPVNIDQSSEPDTISLPTTTENTTAGQVAPTVIERPSNHYRLEQPSSVEAQTEHQQRAQEGLGFCRPYIPRYAKRGSSAYLRGLNRCWYGND